jgi:hypothetical protein
MSEQLTTVPNLEVTVEQAEAAEALDKSTLEPVHDSAAIEQQMVKEEQDRLNKEPDQEELACMMLKLYTPRFNALIDQLSNRQLRRVIKSLVEFPLGRDYQHNDPKEKECFAIGQGLQDAKMVLILKTYNDNKEKIVAMAEEARAAANEATKNMSVEFNAKDEESV